MVRVLVLGGTGFVGPFVVQQLLEEGCEVTVFHRGRHEPALTAGAQHVHGEFARLREHLPTLTRRGLDVVVDVNPGLAKAGHGVLHFAGIASRGVVLTSMDVYRAMSVLWGVDAGPPQQMPVTEESELRSQPSPDLGANLDFDNLDVERAVAARNDELAVTVLRCPVIYGPLDTQRRLRRYVRAMADARPAILLDSRLARLRLTRGYVENVAHAVVTAIVDDRSAGRIYNAGEQDALSEAEWARAVGAAFGWNGDVVVAKPSALPGELRVPLPDQDLVADTSLIRHELEYAELLSRSEGLARAIEWERAQQRDEPQPDYSSEDAALLDASH